MLPSCVDTDVSCGCARGADSHDPLGDHRRKSWCRCGQVVAQLVDGAAVDEDVRRRLRLRRPEQSRAWSAAGTPRAREGTVKYSQQPSTHTENARGAKVARRTVNGCNGSPAADTAAMISIITRTSPATRWTRADRLLPCKGRHRVYGGRNACCMMLRRTAHAVAILSALHVTQPRDRCAWSD